MAAIISRAQWGAQYRNGVGSRPVGSLEKYLHHTVTVHLSANATRAQEEAQMRVLERIGQQRFGGGISYSYLIFPSGRIYEGASADRISYHSGAGRNTRGVGIALVGNFEANALNLKAFNAVVWLLQYGVRAGLWGDPALTGYHKQFRSTACPGKYAIGRFGDINKAGRGGKVAAPSSAVGTAKADSVDRVNINAVMETDRAGVVLRSARNSQDDSNIVATLGSAGWDLLVLYKQGSWARVQRGGKQWVAWAHLREVKGQAWPHGNVPATDRHTTPSHNAWVKMLAGNIGPNKRGYRNGKLTVSVQQWLRDLGYYKGRVDGRFGPVTVKALQRFLRSKGFYKGLVDGVRGGMTVRAEIAYLNSQRKFYV